MAESYADPSSDTPDLDPPGATRVGDATRVGIVLGDDEPRPPGIDVLGDEARITVVHIAEIDRLAELCGDCEVLFVWEFRNNVLRDALPRMPDLRWIQTASAGVDAVMSPELAERGIVVTNTRGVLDSSIAEWVLGVLLVMVKDLRQTLELQRAHEWRHRESERLGGRRLLVVGAGSVGRGIARLVRAVGMEVDGIARDARTDDVDFGRVYATGELLDRLPHYEFVVVSAPLTAETRGLIGPAELAAMPPGGRLVNVGRGPVVNQGALLEALRSGHLRGAALDVFEEEPLAADHPFWDRDDVIVSPHQSGDFEGWRAAFTDVFVENLRRWRHGEPLQNQVDTRAAAGGANPGRSA